MTFKKRGLIFIMALYEEKNTADMLGRLWKRTVLLSYVLNGELFIQRKHLKGRQIDRQKRQHRCCNFFFLPTSIGRLAKESNLVVGNLTGFFFLFLLLALLGVFVKYFTKIFPPTFRDKDGITKVALDFADGNVSPLCVFLTRKEKVLVLDSNMPRLRSLRGRFSFTVIVFFDQLFQMIVELFHSIGGNEDLKARIAARESLRDFEAGMKI